ncbi:homoserine dehydrogenase [Desulforamulus hydrothermalis]|uniref:Homoserine dehydrogenase n=1 Tax=Desulforamulus hydrothermalis Lam5 = DSM 18033 TaxID=1121428 RepID=K8EBJ6_9FIRM|nr:homoserine dehydrogenase [Desulforamulus hydrothermalis]CCO09033.1 Homoserine dehydrogenase [Desulforamulus hydrothermalis Lam5 = DSM 18033]SHG77449.1 homoserine dehydrogenase [Desulforamulus hydrothermalis Lam5 = DSM 18033]
MEQVIKIGLLGLGTVGRGVYRILAENRENIRQRVGIGLEIKKIMVRNLDKDRGLSLPEGILTTNIQDITNDPEIKIVVEVLGGIQPALDYVLEALNRGKSVVTANKDMVAEHGQRLFKAAQTNQCDLLFEASVAGGIPIIRTLKQSLAGNRIDEVFGIINGTTNYMLTKMTQEGCDFKDVLQEAQAKGYAEADPTADVGGFDAARKIAILASIAFNTRIPLQQVYTEGITHITPQDILYANELGYIIKLLGIAKNRPEGVEVRVHPTFIPKDHPLAAVGDAFNAVFVRGNAVGDTMFYGRGAGELPTASAVVADIMDAARDIIRNVPGIIGCTCFKQLPVLPVGETLSKYYIRLRVADKPGVLASIALVFGNKEVSLKSVIQKEATGKTAELVLVTHRVQEQNVQDALMDIKQLSSVMEVANVIRVEGEE